jgi:protein phosphatase
LLADRYLCKGQRVFLDTKPGFYPRETADISPELIPYLRLSPYRIHVPQVYAVVRSPGSNQTAPIALLNQVPVRVNPSEAEGDIPPEQITLAPRILDAWETATALRQLNWLWQLAQLWQPLSQEKVASTLLHPELLRVEGSRLRLLELCGDGAADAPPPELADLGSLWLPWIQRAAPPLQEGLTALCQHLQDGELHNPDQVLDYLDLLLARVGRSHPRWVQIATYTDQGPSRQRNEDACYPPSGTVAELAIPPNPSSQTDESSLVIVCDGIGGHQGGDVASHLAIDTVLQQITGLAIDDLSPNTLVIELEKAACAANDVISQRNDSERRFERQRMGTTLVIGLIRGHELYITHVGDSRAYWITPWGCQQVTLDDDVASREVRLGYGLYREALQQPGAGSLVQALGMGASNLLHPTVQRFILDEDSVFLLCSDGLSDNDRVEQYWDTRILPILNGTADIGAVGQQLINLANTSNGHDNVTVGLIHCHVDSPRRGTQLKLPLPQLTSTIPATTAVVSPGSQRPASLSASSPATVLQTAPMPSPQTPAPPSETPVPGPKPAKPASGPLWPLMLGILVLLALGGGLLYVLFPSVRQSIGLLRQDPTPLDAASPSVEPIEELPGLATGDLLQLATVPEATPDVSGDRVRLYPSSSQDQPPAELSSQFLGLPAGTILQIVQVVSATSAAQGQRPEWVKVTVCQLTEPEAIAPSPPPGDTLTATPSPAASDQGQIRAGDQGWVNAADLQPPDVTPLDVSDLSADAQVICPPLSEASPDDAATIQISRLLE